MVEKASNSNFRTKVRLNYINSYAKLSPFLILNVFNNFDGLRNRLPEPFDYLDHAGNIPPSIFAATATSAGFAIHYNRKSNKKNVALSEKRIRSAMILGATSVALIINGLTETKLGISITQMRDTTTPDNVDLVYGVIAAGAISALLPTVTQEPIGEFNTQNQLFYEYKQNTA